MSVRRTLQASMKLLVDEPSASNEPQPGSRRVILPLLLWSIAFGYLEAAVVVYLRRIYYPDGFSFPLVPLDRTLVNIEVLREGATLVLLWGVAHLSVRGTVRRFAAFAFCFGIWDLVFYLALKGALSWPATIMDWDILFLIPLPWCGPVLAPVLVSLALVGAGTSILLSRKAEPVRLRARDWGIEILCAAIILASFLWNVPVLAKGGAPRFFPWALFLLGFVPGGAFFLYKWRRARRDAGVVNEQARKAG